MSCVISPVNLLGTATLQPDSNALCRLMTLPGRIYFQQKNSKSGVISGKNCRDVTPPKARPFALSAV
jgi:hypothetical protein